MMKLTRTMWVGLCLASSASAQSSSLYLQVEPIGPMMTASAPGSPGQFNPSRQDTLPQAVTDFSFTAVTPPRPRYFAVNDLVTVIVRESTTTDFNAKLDTEKTSEFEGEISDFPRLDPWKLLQMQLQASKNENPPKVGINFERTFEGDGSYSTSNSISSRITARVIDVKPNGTLVIEARKRIQSDDETLNLVLTGTCRAEDVAVDNTILSTSLYDLNLVKDHDGELRQASKKGLLTKLFDFLFAF